MYTGEQYEMLKKWWEQAGMTAPLKELLPETTLIASIAGTPYLSVSLFLTNSPIVWIDNFIGNPNVDLKLRASLTPKFLDYVKTFARNLGKKRFFCMSSKKSTSRFYKQLGFLKTAEVETFIGEIK